MQARLRERRSREPCLCGHGSREARTWSLDAFLARDSCPGLLQHVVAEALLLIVCGPSFFLALAARGLPCSMQDL